MSEYRIMQVGRSSFYVEKFETNDFGLFPKWRALGRFEGIFPVKLVHYFPTKEEAQAYAEEHAEFSAGPKVVAV